MTLSEAVRDFREKHDAPFDDATLAEWVAEVDAFAVDEVISKCGENMDFKLWKLDFVKDRDACLSIPFPDCGIYYLYLAAKCDLTLGDTKRYNISALAFENAWKAFADRYFRNNMPRGANFYLGGELELFQSK